MRKLFFIFVLILFPLLGFAEQSTSAILSPKCDEAKLREIAGEALIKIIETTSLEGGGKIYSITLEITKLTFGDLTKKMMEQGCF